MKSKIIFLSLGLLFFCNCQKNSITPANEVYMNNSQFSPASITVGVGTTIVWTNKESATHTVTSDSPLFESGDMGKSKSFSYTFTTAGTFPYHCKYHSTMKATVIVN